MSFSQVCVTGLRLNVILQFPFCDINILPDVSSY